MALHPWNAANKIPDQPVPHCVPRRGTRASLQVLRVVLDAVAPEKLLELGQRVESLVMLLLMADVLGYIVKHRLADRETAISLLPRERAEPLKGVVDPLRRSLLDMTKHVCVAEVRWVDGEQVKMIGGSIDRDRNAAKVLQRAANEWIESLFEFWRDRLDAALCAKDGVVDVLRP